MREPAEEGSVPVGDSGLPCRTEPVKGKGSIHTGDQPGRGVRDQDSEEAMHRGSVLISALGKEKVR